MKLIPVDAIPKVSGYHKLQELIEEFVNGDAKIVKVDFIKTDDRRTADHCRTQILHFNNELLRPIYHTKEEFVEVLAKIDDYERYCEEHPEYPNNRAVLAIENIREVYKERLKKRDFLQESQPRMGEDFPRS